MEVVAQVVRGVAVVMSITVVCPKCKRAYEVQSRFAGHSARCKACQSKMTVPVPAKASLKAAPQAGSSAKTLADDPMALLKVAAAMERTAQVEPAPIIEVSVTARSSGFGQKFKALFGKR